MRTIPGGIYWLRTVAELRRVFDQDLWTGRYSGQPEPESKGTEAGGRMNWKQGKVEEMRTRGRMYEYRYSNYMR